MFIKDHIRFTLQSNEQHFQKQLFYGDDGVLYFIFFCHLQVQSYASQ